jgi:hypothetical protein
MVTFRGEAYNSVGTFHFKNSTPLVANSCTGTSQSVASSNAVTASRRVFAVADMTGDGKPDIMVVHPESTTIGWLTSESGFTAFVSRADVGTHRAIVF